MDSNYAFVSLLGWTPEQLGMRLRKGENIYTWFPTLVAHIGQLLCCSGGGRAPVCSTLVETADRQPFKVYSWVTRRHGSQSTPQIKLRMSLVEIVMIKR